MVRPSIALLVLFIAGLPAASAQESPYVDRVSQTIKALTPDEIRRYLAGEGMGYALAAELNGYPGPRHVLELADSLRLTADGRVKAQEVFDAMHTEAVRLGEAIVAAEASLDSAFARHRVTASDLETRLSRIADLQRQLRFAHLSAHLRMMTVVEPHQIQAYRRLRGYATDHQHH